ncbi:MAG: winged helix-turn-helix transcriptional regulator [Nocardioidaceae bacterium]
MGLGRDYTGQDCSLARALELVGERWTFLIIRDAFYGVRRYSDFLSHLGIPRAVLAERLQVLTGGGVLDRRRYQEAPARDEYLLTEAGLQLWAPLYTLAQWGEEHRSNGGARRIFEHAPCRSTLDRLGLCPSCGTNPPPEQIEVRPGPGAATPGADDPVGRALQRPHTLLQPLPTTG